MFGNDVLVVIDMQNDFINGSLGTKEAQAIVPTVCEVIKAHQGLIYYTQDTHHDDYFETQEGHYLPVAHCQKDSDGWQLHPEVGALLKRKMARKFEKDGFGSLALAETLQMSHADQPMTSITLVGLCTDICVIANAMLIKSALPNVPLYIRADACAGVTPESHQTALSAMEMCQMAIRHG